MPQERFHLYALPQHPMSPYQYMGDDEQETSMVTAKVQCQSKQESGEGDSRQAVVTFVPDYADGRNKEWSRYTPHLSLQMTLKGAVADRFEQGKAYTLTFTEES